MVLNANKIAVISGIIAEATERIQNEAGISVQLSVNRMDKAELLIIESVVITVAEALGVSPLLIFSSSRKREVLYARYICLRFAREFVKGLSDEKMGDMFNRDRTSIIHAFETINDLISTRDGVFTEMLTRAEAAIKTHIGESINPLYINSQ